MNTFQLGDAVRPRGDIASHGLSAIVVRVGRTWITVRVTQASTGATWEKRFAPGDLAQGGAK